MIGKFLVFLAFLPLCVLSERIELASLYPGELLSASRNGTIISVQQNGKGADLFLRSPNGETEKIDSLSDYQSDSFDASVDDDGNAYYTKQIGWIDDGPMQYYYRKKGLPALKIFEIEGTSRLSRPANSGNGYHFVTVLTNDDKARVVAFFEATKLYELVLTPSTIESDEKSLSVNCFSALRSGAVVISLRSGLTRRTVVISPDGVIKLLDKDEILDSADRWGCFIYANERSEVFFNYDDGVYKSDLAAPPVRVITSSEYILSLYDEETFLRREAAGDTYLFVSPESGTVSFNICNMPISQVSDKESIYFDMRTSVAKLGSNYALIDRSGVYILPNSAPENFCTKINLRQIAGCANYFRPQSDGSLRLIRDFGQDLSCSFRGKIADSNNRPLPAKRVRILESVPSYGKPRGIKPIRSRSNKRGEFDFRLKFKANSTGFDVKGPVGDKFYRPTVRDIAGSE